MSKRSVIYLGTHYCLEYLSRLESFMDAATTCINAQGKMIMYCACPNLNNKKKFPTTKQCQGT